MTNLKKQDAKIERVKKFKRFGKFVIIFHSIVVFFGVVYLSFPSALWTFVDMKSKQRNVDPILLAASDAFFPLRFYEVNCSAKGYRNEQLLGAAPHRCGVMVDDYLIANEEALKLREIVKTSIEKFGSSRRGAPENVNIKRIKLFEFVIRGLRNKVIDETDYDLIKNVSERIKEKVSLSFGIQSNNLHFTPISEATRFKPLVEFQEFKHVDKVRSPPLVVTSIIWLSTFQEHFNGGRLHFLTVTPLLIEPKLGRFAAWTSSYECPHEVQELMSGERYGLLFALSVDPNAGHKSIDEMRNWYNNKV